MARNKYRFPSRLAAEQAFAKASRERATAAIALSAVLNGRIARELSVGEFTVRITHSKRRMSYQLILSESLACDGITECSHSVMDADEWVSDMDRLALPDNPLREVLEVVRTSLHQLYEQERMLAG